MVIIFTRNFTYSIDGIYEWLRPFVFRANIYMYISRHVSTMRYVKPIENFSPRRNRKPRGYASRILFLSIYDLCWKERRTARGRRNLSFWFERVIRIFRLEEEEGVSIINIDKSVIPSWECTFWTNTCCTFIPLRVCQRNLKKLGQIDPRYSTNSSLNYILIIKGEKAPFNHKRSWISS